MAILIVDDSEDFRLLLQAVLTAAGHADMLFAESAQAAFDLLEVEKPDRGEAAVDLILMDIEMPGVNGVDACRRIKAADHLQDVPLIMITAHSDPETLQAAFASGAMDYITKPMKKVELLARVRSALKLKGETDRCKAKQRELIKANQELQQALQEIKVLRGIIPICAWCKKIRDDHGYWDTVETYISAHSDANFSHGICPACLDKVYPDKGKTEAQR